MVQYRYKHSAIFSAYDMMASAHFSSHFDISPIKQEVEIGS